MTAGTWVFHKNDHRC